MNIGIAGPISLDLLTKTFAGLPTVAGGFPFAQSAALASELHRRGHSVTIFTLDAGRTETRLYTGDRWAVSISGVRTSARARGRDLFRQEREQLQKAMSASGCEVLHANWSYEYALAARSTGLPTLVTLHDWPPAILRVHRDPYRLARLMMAIRVMATCTRFVAVSPYIAGRLRRWTRRESSVIPNAVSGSWFYDSGQTRIDGRILAVNNGWDRGKNVAALLRALPAIRAEHPEAHLDLVGVGYEVGGPAYQWAVAEGLDARVRFLGPRDTFDVARMMQVATLLVHPSLEESFGVVLIEAMASGLPVVAGRRSGGIPWVLGDGANGQLTDVRYASSISEVVAQLLHRTDERRRLAESGHRAVRERFAIDRIADGYEREYVRALVNSPSRATQA